MHFSPGTILVVDDQEIIRELLERLLRTNGHRVLTAASGAKAIALLRVNPVDMIFLDMMMPGMSGVEVLQQLKSNPATANIPVIVISADSDVERIANCLSLGAEDYIIKPFNAVVLDARVAACLERHRLRAQEQAYRLTLEAQVAERTALAEQRAAALMRSEADLRQQSNILQSILINMGDGVVVVDSQGQLIHHNPAAMHILGPHFQALLPGDGETQTSFYHQDQRTAVAIAELPLVPALAGQAVDDFELMVAPMPGKPLQWLSITARPLREGSAAISGAVAVIRDISAAKHAEIALRESEERYALASRGANDGLWDWDLRTNTVYFSPRWKALLGYSEDEIGNSFTEWITRVHPDDRDRLEVRLTAHFRRLISHFEHEYRICHRDGTYRWMLCRGIAVWNAAGEALRMAGSQTEITDRKLVEQQLMHDALHDGLTGLPNRALFIDRLEHAISRSQRNPEHHFAVLFLDLDRFKVINDSLGHSAGDQLLIKIASILQLSLRPGDTVARLGGDEFTILLDEITAEDNPLKVAERIQQLMANPIKLDNQEAFTTASIGIVLSSAEYRSANDMIRDADTAMYHAKLGGKARAAVFDPSMHEAALSLLQLESDLRRAIERNELCLYYQPIVRLDTGLMIGMEALLRWQHPQRGMLTPNEFLPIAEETGMIVQIGWWVLREACLQMRRWHAESSGMNLLSLNINLSEKQLIEPDAVAQIQAILAETGMPGELLKLEITEHTLLAHHEVTIHKLHEIRKLGIQLCIDDFGTGYSSLNYLQRFPINVLKIDRSFVQMLGRPGEQSEIVQAIIALANALKLQAVAEGTETNSQVEELRRLNCEYGQGWFFSQALNVEAINRLVRTGQSLA
ncbi:MAG: EAL domain-containing protein [Oscillochloridaceae bacterium umkhey_bin13]